MNAMPSPSPTVLMLYCAQLDVGNGFVIITEMGMLLLHTLYLFQHSVLLLNCDYEVISVNIYVPEQLIICQITTVHDTALTKPQLT